jgi:tetraacyldisaccharide 4'-kinase
MARAPASPPGWRRRWFAAPGRQQRLRRPVISVGNLAFGGRGKTPLVARLAQLLVELGERPAILARGYARRQPDDGVVVVSDGAHLLADLARSGDEPLMLARMAPGARVLVCEQRVLAGALAERALGATVHVLDDGFQHLALARDLDLVVVTESDLRGRPAPFGRLRESPRALACADAVVVETSATPVPVESWVDPRSAVFRLRRSLGEPVGLDPDQLWIAGADRHVVAVAGIAQPERFVNALGERGWGVVDVLRFGDHHAYTRADVSRIIAASRRAGAPILTTEKDAMRLLPLRPFAAPIAYVPLTVTVEPEDAFRTWLVDGLRQARARADRQTAS